MIANTTRYDAQHNTLCFATSQGFFFNDLWCLNFFKVFYGEDICGVREKFVSLSAKRDIPKGL